MVHRTYLRDSSLVIDLLFLLSILAICFSIDLRFKRSSSKSFLNFKISTVSEPFVGVEESAKCKKFEHYGQRSLRQNFNLLIFDANDSGVEKLSPFELSALPIIGGGVAKPGFRISSVFLDDE